LKRIENWIETTLFGMRWLLAPFYLGLGLALVMLLAVFVRELAMATVHLVGMSVEDAILTLLTLIDLSLAANLTIIIILAGYENFVSKIDTAEHEDRPGWMGKVGFSGLKLKLYGSVVAISGIQLLKAFLAIGHDPASSTQLAWMTGIHVAFVVTAVLSALTDWLSARAKGSVA